MMEYDYYCAICDLYFIRRCLIEERHNQVCDCGAPAEKIMSVPADAIFKGGGWGGHIGT